MNTNNIKNQLAATHKASRDLALLHPSEIEVLINSIAESILTNADLILDANKLDLAKMDLQNPMYDRLELTSLRIKSLADALNHIAKLPCPVGTILEKRKLPNGLDIQRISVPLGVIGVIYEARPNVTLDVAALCFKSGNACILKGGSDAHYTNSEIIRIIKNTIEACGHNPDFVNLLPADRSSVQELFGAHGLVDVLIPRGGSELIDFVRKNSQIPVIETGAGIVHTYIDADADIDMATKVITNAKTRRPSVCNSLDTLIVHQDQLENLYKLVGDLATKDVLIFADTASFEILEHQYPDHLLLKAQPKHFGTEFLSLKMSIKVVKDIDEALSHIATYSSKHSEAIISKNNSNIERFVREVDAAAVYANTSTAFTDGGEFGLGAEIGISTQKLHARGPMGLEALTSYKWVVKGNGQCRAV